MRGYASSRTGSGSFLELSVMLKRDGLGNPSGFRAIGRDVTERRKTREALRQSEQRYRSFVENSFMGMFLCDFRTARLLQVNRRFCEMFGNSREEILGLTILDLLDPAEHPG